MRSKRGYRVRNNIPAYMHTDYGKSQDLYTGRKDLSAKLVIKDRPKYFKKLRRGSETGGGVWLGKILTGKKKSQEGNNLLLENDFHFPSRLKVRHLKAGLFPKQSSSDLFCNTDSPSRHPAI